MTGRIQYFQPSGRQGILQADNGVELIFTVSGDHIDLHGGDIVEFETGLGGRPVVTDIKLRQRWADTLNEEHKSLINEFHNTVKIVPQL